METFLGDCFRQAIARKPVQRRINGRARKAKSGHYRD